MSLDPSLLEVLVCPHCGGEVEYVAGEEKIVCRGRCGYRYPVKEGIPVMLIEEAEKP